MCQVKNKNSLLKGRQRETSKNSSENCTNKPPRALKMWSDAWLQWNSKIATGLWEILHIYTYTHMYLERKILYSFKKGDLLHSAGTWSCENPLSDLAIDSSPDDVQQCYTVRSNEKCFVSLDFARTHEYVMWAPSCYIHIMLCPVKRATVYWGTLISNSSILCT